MVKPPAIPLPTIVTLWTGSRVGEVGYHCMACLMIGKYSCINLMELAALFSGPISTLSIASSMSLMVIILRLALAAKMAASFSTFSRSAPEKPGVLLAITFKSTSGCSGLPGVNLQDFNTSLQIRPIYYYFAVKPARSEQAGSRTSALFVAAITMMPELVSKPSISTSSWLRSAHAHHARRRGLPALTANSIKLVDEDEARCILLGILKEIPNPGGTDPHKHFHKFRAADAEKRYARFSRNCPGQQRLTRTWRSNQQDSLGDFAPTSLYFFGCFRKSTISTSSCFASSTPATCSKVILRLSS